MTAAKLQIIKTMDTENLFYTTVPIIFIMAATYIIRSLFTKSKEKILKTTLILVPAFASLFIAQGCLIFFGNKFMITNNYQICSAITLYNTIPTLLHTTIYSIWSSKKLIVQISNLVFCSILVLINYFYNSEFAKYGLSFVTKLINTILTIVLSSGSGYVLYEVIDYCYGLHKYPTRQKGTDND